MASNPTTRPRGAARREALLDATLALVGELGADAVTHRRVAGRAGLPLASTTYWFDSKEQLLTEALAHAAARDIDRLHQAAEAELARAGLVAGPRSDHDPDAPRSLTPGAIIRVLGAGPGGVHPGADRGALMATYALMLEAARRPALQQLSQRWTDAYLETIGELLQHAGSRRPVDDARLLVAACDGLVIDDLATGGVSGADPRPELERLLGALLGRDAR
jgi:AcrR family transcriptional regulator